MKKAIKIWLFTATALILVGAMIFVGALAAVDFDFKRLSTDKFETNNYEFNEAFEHISINTKTATIKFVATDDDVCKIECLEEENMKHFAKVQNGTLMIWTVDSRKWHDYIGINFQTPTVTVYLPKEAYISLAIATLTGDVEIPDSLKFETVAVEGTTANITCCADISESIKLNTTTGNITLEATKTKTVNLSATTGNIHLKNVIAQDIKAENSTGGVHLDRCDAFNIRIKTSTGDVKGSLLSEKVFITKTSTGSVSVPSTASGGRCDIKTNTGDIKIEIK